MRILLAILICAVGCNEYSDKTNNVDTFYGVHKFQDGDVVCYIYYHEGISCLREKK